MSQKTEYSKAKMLNIFFTVKTPTKLRIIQKMPTDRREEKLSMRSLKALKFFLFDRVEHLFLFPLIVSIWVGFELIAPGRHDYAVRRMFQILSIVSLTPTVYEIYQSFEIMKDYIRNYRFIPDSELFVTVLGEINSTAVDIHRYDGISIGGAVISEVRRHLYYIDNRGYFTSPEEKEAVENACALFAKMSILNLESTQEGTLGFYFKALSYVRAAETRENVSDDAYDDKYLEYKKIVELTPSAYVAKFGQNIPAIHENIFVTLFSAFSDMFYKIKDFKVIQSQSSLNDMIEQVRYWYFIFNFKFEKINAPVSATVVPQFDEVDDFEMRVTKQLIKLRTT